jgi:hypothetical protein
MSGFGKMSYWLQNQRRRFDEANGRRSKRPTGTMRSVSRKAFSDILTLACSS